MIGIVVEGFNDEYTLRKVLPHAHFVVTKGTRLNNRVRMDINSALKDCRHVYLMTDPDEAGEFLATMLLAEFPMLTRIHLDPEECKCYRNRRLKIGVEHASLYYLRMVFQKVLTDKENDLLL